jgi:hypothetical protein
LSRLPLHSQREREEGLLAAGSGSDFGVGSGTVLLEVHVERIHLYLLLPPVDGSGCNEKLEEDG